MRFHRWVTALALIAALGLAADARAQTGYVEGFGGVLIVDDGKIEDFGVTIDPALLLGVVLGYAPAPRWEVAAAYGYAPATAEDDEANEFDANVHAYFGAVNYLFPSDPATFLLTAGIGGLTIDPDVVDEDGESLDSSNDLMVNFGAGVRFMATDRIAIQGVVRDYVQFCKAADEGESKISLCPDDDSTLNHIEVSGGVLVLF